MHRLYRVKYESQADKPVVKEWLYRKIFNEEFNLSFGYPRSDTCQLCDELNLAISSSSAEERLTELNLELAQHQLKASHGYQALREDTEKSKSDIDLHVITFDLQQNLPVPTLTHSSMFYLRQLWVYNFGIHNCSTGDATMCVWNEAVAGRSPNEIISCLFKYFSKLRSGATKLVCYSDSCFGQNKNFSMICFWNSLILQKLFKRIDHKFLVRGHTYLPNDRDFSHIERKKATTRVYVPEQWEDVIATCRPSNPFEVQRMTSEFFLDFSELEKKHTRRKQDLSKRQVLISKVTWMNFGEAIVNKSGKEVTQEHPNEVWLRYTYVSAEPWSKVSLLKGRKKTQLEVDLSALTRLDHAGVNPKKVEDLQKMLPYIPEEHRPYYRNLPVAKDDHSDMDYAE